MNEIHRFISVYNYLVHHPKYDYKKIANLTTYHTNLLFFLSKLDVSPHEVIKF